MERTSRRRIIRGRQSRVSAIFAYTKVEATAGLMGGRDPSRPPSPGLRRAIGGPRRRGVTPEQCHQHHAELVQRRHQRRRAELWRARNSRTNVVPPDTRNSQLRAADAARAWNFGQNREMPPRVTRIPPGCDEGGEVRIDPVVRSDLGGDQVSAANSAESSPEGSHASMSSSRPSPGAPPQGFQQTEHQPLAACSLKVHRTRPGKRAFEARIVLSPNRRVAHPLPRRRASPAPRAATVAALWRKAPP